MDYLGLVVESARRSLVNPVRNSRWSPKNGLIGEGQRDEKNLEDLLLYHVPPQYRDRMARKFYSDVKRCILDTVRDYCRIARSGLPKEAQYADLCLLDLTSTYKLRDVVLPVHVNDNASGVSRSGRLRIVLIASEYDNENWYKPGMNIKTTPEGDCHRDVDVDQLKSILDNLEDASIEHLSDAINLNTPWFDLHQSRSDLRLGVCGPGTFLAGFNFDAHGDLIDWGVDSSDSDIEFMLYVYSDDDMPFAYRISDEIPVSSESLA